MLGHRFNYVNGPSFGFDLSIVGLLRWLKDRWIPRDVGEYIVKVNFESHSKFKIFVYTRCKIRSLECLVDFVDFRSVEDTRTIMSRDRICP